MNSYYEEIAMSQIRARMGYRLFDASPIEKKPGIYVYPDKNRPEIIEALPGEIEESPSD